MKNDRFNQLGRSETPVHFLVFLVMHVGVALSEVNFLEQQKSTCLNATVVKIFFQVQINMVGFNM